MNTSRIAGLVITAIGLLSGFALVAQAFVPQMELQTGAALMLFLGALSFGMALYATGPDRRQALRLGGYALLLLGLSALIGITVDALGIHAATRPTTLLWIVCPVGILGGLLLSYFAVALGRLDDTAR